MYKAICLLSGGLDSALATKIIKDQNIKVLGLILKSIFFQVKHAYIVAEYLKIPIKTIDISSEILQLLLNKPKYGFGQNMNPCIDCHICMLKKAKELMQELGYDFVVTGEVLGERKKSQTKQALKIIEKDSGLEGYLLRPLSAKLLQPTLPETKNWVDREKFYAISGKRRSKQLELAKKLNIQGYSTPAGGCKLTDPNFSKRLKDLLTHTIPDFNDIELLKIGRHFRLSKNTKLIISRNDQENQKLAELIKPFDTSLMMRDYKGPLGLIRGEVDNQILLKSAALLARYSKGKKAAYAWVSIKRNNQLNRILVQPKDYKELEITLLQ
jgi:tRNA U34 2-thiouridine synthase MnmA/TrmU